MSHTRPSQPAPGRFNWFLWERFASRPSVNGYSRQIKNLDELREVTRRAVEGQLAPGEQPLQIIYAPYQTLLGSQPGPRAKGIWFLPWEYTRDRVIVLTGQRLLAVDLDEQGQLAEAFSAPLDDMFYLQGGKILLFSWLDWVWIEDGQARRLRCYFNSVCDGIYAILTEAVRRALIAPAGERAQPEPRGLTLLGDLPYKFRNLLPKHLLEDEQIEQVVFRTSRWERPARVWPVHTMAKAVVALTNTHLLLAEEELTHSEDAYGLIVTYLPRRRIQAIHLREGDRGADLSIQMGLAEAPALLNIPAPVELRPELEQIVQAITLENSLAALHPHQP